MSLLFIVFPQVGNYWIFKLETLEHRKKIIKPHKDGPPAPVQQEEVSEEEVFGPSPLKNKGVESLSGE